MRRPFHENRDRELAKYRQFLTIMFLASGLFGACGGTIERTQQVEPTTTRTSEPSTTANSNPPELSAPPLRACSTSGIRPSIQIEKFVHEPDGFEGALSAELARPSGPRIRMTRADVAAIEMTAVDQCQLTFDAEASTTLLRWMRAVEGEALRGAFIIRGANASAIPVYPSASGASVQAHFACDDERIGSLCEAERERVASRALAGLGVWIDVPTAWTIRAAPTGFVLMDENGVALPVNIGRRALPGLSRDVPPIGSLDGNIVLETGAVYRRQSTAVDTLVTVQLPSDDGQATVCTTSEAFEDICASLRMTAAVVR